MSLATARYNADAVSKTYELLIIIIMNIKDWTLFSVPSPDLQLLSPTFLWSSNCPPSLWSVVV